VARGDHHIDLVAAAREVMGKLGPRQANSISINDAAGTISDRATGELYGYVSPAWTALSAGELLGWHTWPVKIPTR
jgi:hypothetical protein